MHDVLQETKRRLPIGAEVVDGGVHFRIWAPRRIQVEVVFENSNRRLRLSAEGNGYFSGFAPDIPAVQTAETESEALAGGRGGGN